MLHKSLDDKIHEYFADGRTLFSSANFERTVGRYYLQGQKRAQELGYNIVPLHEDTYKPGFWKRNPTERQAWTYMATSTIRNQSEATKHLRLQVAYLGKSYVSAKAETVIQSQENLLNAIYAEMPNPTDEDLQDAMEVEELVAFELEHN